MIVVGRTITIAMILGAAAIAHADQAKAPSAGAAVVAPMPPKSPPPAMPEMTPPKEIADAAKGMIGTYACKGNVTNPDGSSRPSLSTMKIATDLGGFYIVIDLAEKKTADNPHPFQAHMFRTYDAAKKAWTTTMLANAPGGPETETTTDAVGAGTPVVWNSTGEMMGQKFTERAHEEPDAKAKTVHLWGEVSMDGKTWMKDYDMTCKK